MGQGRLGGGSGVDQGRWGRARGAIGAGGGGVTLICGEGHRVVLRWVGGVGGGDVRWGGHVHI